MRFFGRDDTDIHLYLQCLDLHFLYAKKDDIVVGFTQGVNKGVKHSSADICARV